MAERLKGLLDSAKAKIGGLLGDFPQGFNAGAVAGVAGYPGDIAYMLDTAGRALTGQDTQPAAQDFPGTTEYIANKAGYPVPQSFSGQLGAAVGGVLTPGPGDLAKFAPVLSAIPFWHGSPHKYDAVDLSKIGTGEGAQAYGHGYYGADSRAVAEDFAARRAGKAKPYKEAMGIDTMPAPTKAVPDMRLYHGSTESFDDFNEAYGGTYFAEKPSVSEFFGTGKDGTYHGAKEYEVDTGKMFDAQSKNADDILDRIEAKYDNATDYKDPDDGEYMPLKEWVKSGYLFKLGRKVQNEVMESLRAEGFDSIRYLDASPATGDSVSVVVFDPKRIKRPEK